MVACSDTKGSVREGKDSLNPPTPTIKTTTNDGRVWQLEAVKRKYLASILSTSTGLGGLQKQTNKNYIVDCSVTSTLATKKARKTRSSTHTKCYTRDTEAVT